VVDSSLTRLYESPWVKSKYEKQDGISPQGFETTPMVDPPLDISKLKNVDISYIDLLGDIYYSSWCNK
jgi:hypothetical protein